VKEEVEQPHEIDPVGFQIPPLGEIRFQEEGAFHQRLEHLLAHRVTNGPEHGGSNAGTGGGPERSGDDAPDGGANQCAGRGPRGGPGLLDDLLGDRADRLRRKECQGHRGDEEHDVGFAHFWGRRPGLEVAELDAAEYGSARYAGSTRGASLPLTGRSGFPHQLPASSVYSHQFTILRATHPPQHHQLVRLLVDLRSRAPLGGIDGLAPPRATRRSRARNSATSPEWSSNSTRPPVSSGRNAP
jgi:hypothetical protein